MKETITATTTVTSVPPIRIAPGSWSTAYATRAPKVISSPCAKFVRPVVPKIIERPSAAMASSVENTMPPTSSCRPWVAMPSPPAASPTGKLTETSLSRLICTSRVTSSGLRSAVPSGIDFSSTLTVKVLPRLSTVVPGSGISNVPSAVVVASPTTLPDSSSTVMSTPSTGVWGVSLVSQIRPRMEIVSSSVISGRTQAGASAAVGAAAAAACAVPDSASTATTTASNSPAMRLMPVCMGLLSPSFENVSRDYSECRA